MCVYDPCPGYLYRDLCVYMYVHVWGVAMLLGDTLPLVAGQCLIQSDKQDINMQGSVIAARTASYTL